MTLGTKSQRLVTLLSSLALVAGCAAYDDGADVKVAVDDGTLAPAARNCPPGGCDEPPDPPDDDPPPEPPTPPEQPDPAKARFLVVPTQFIQESLNLALGGTLVQVSHTTGESLALPGTVHTCHSEPNDDVASCLEFCNELENKYERGPCRAKCGSKQVCNYFCSNTATSALSFVKWGPLAKAISEPKTCTPNTCPVCTSPTQVPSLEDEELPVPIYRKTVASIPGFSYDVACKMNRLQFRGDTRSIVVTSAPDGIRVRFPGSTGSPSVICSNAPDVTIHDPAVQLRFSFPWFGLSTMRLDADLQGDVDTGAGPVVDYLADIGDRLKGTFAEVAGNRLNKDKFKPTYRKLILGLIQQYITAQHLDHLAIPGRIETLDQGLKVQYWTD